MGEGDTELVLDVLPPELASTAFQRLRDEVKWNHMIHKGMLCRFILPNIR